MIETRKITRAAGIIGGGTLISRVVGYARDAVIAAFFGAGMAADAFFVAFRLANLLRRLVGEGALTPSFIPVFTDILRDRAKDEVKGFIARFFTLFSLILIALTILGMLLSPFLVTLLAPGFSSNPEKFSLTVNLTKFMFPYMFFIGLAAAAMGVLHSLRHFTVPAISPIFFNISIILSVFVIAPFLKEPVYALVIGVLAGGALHFGVHLPVLKSKDMLPYASFGFSDPAIKKIFVLMAPSIIGIGVYQLNIFVTMGFASSLGEGSVSYLYYASRLIELPIGVFGVAFTQAVMPSMSEHVSKKDFDSLKSSLTFAMRMVNFVTIPASIGLFVLGMPIIEVLFERGEFTHLDAKGSAYALYFYAIGIAPLASSRIFISLFYSMKDAVTPLWVAVFSFITNIAFCFILIGPLGHGGLALATSIAVIVNYVLLVIMARRTIGRFGAKAIISSSLKVTAASLFMSGVIYAVLIYVGWEWFGIAGKPIMLIVTILAGFFSFVAVCAMLKVKEALFLKEFIEEKLIKPRSRPA